MCDEHSDSSKGQQMCDFLLNNFDHGSNENIVGPRDIHLRSEEGGEFTVHKHVLVRTPFMRNVLYTHFGQCAFGCPAVSDQILYVLLPGVRSRELGVIVRFLYTGVLKCFRHETAKIRQILVDVFGFNAMIDLTDLNKEVDAGDADCVLCNDKTPVVGYFEHLWTHTRDHLDDVKIDIDRDENVTSSQCVVCRKDVTNKDGVVAGKEYLKRLEEHYDTHREMFKELILRAHGYVVKEPDEENVEGQMEIDLTEVTGPEVRNLAASVENLSVVGREQTVSDQASNLATDGSPTTVSSNGSPAKKRRRVSTDPQTTPTAGNVENNAVTSHSGLNGHSNSTTSPCTSPDQPQPTSTPAQQQQQQQSHLSNAKKANPESLYCIDCNQRVSHCSLERHSLTHYKHIYDEYTFQKNESSRFPCELCDKNFDNVYLVKTHLVASHRIFRKHLEKQGKTVKDLYKSNM